MSVPLLLHPHDRLAHLDLLADAHAKVSHDARVRRDENTLRQVAAYRGGAVAELAIRGPVDVSAAAQRTRTNLSTLRSTVSPA